MVGAALRQVMVMGEACHRPYVMNYYASSGQGVLQRHLHCEAPVTSPHVLQENPGPATRGGISCATESRYTYGIIHARMIHTCRYCRKERGGRSS